MRQPTRSECWFVADIGATNSRCALLCPPSFDAREIRHYRNDDFCKLQDLLSRYLQQTSANPTDCALAVAAPVHGEDIRFSNRAWQFRRSEIIDQLQISNTAIINDFEALAYAVPHYGDMQRTEIGKSTRYSVGNIAALGPGSGLGMATWVGNRSNGRVISGEGGHIALAGRNDAEDEIIACMRQQFGHCSAERILSGPGLIALHKVMHNLEVPTSESITIAPDDAKCAATMAQFFLFLGTVAADLALINGALGGVYIAGGIVPACIEQIAKSGFRERFVDKNRHSDYLRAIPTWVITDPMPGLTGLSWYARQGS